MLLKALKTTSKDKAVKERKILIRKMGAPKLCKLVHHPLKTVLVCKLEKNF